MKETLKAEFLNLPNMLTLSRIVGIPIVMLFIWEGGPRDCVIAAWIYSAATVTDYIDGWLARRQGLVTVMGKFLDPLADKLMVMAMLVMLVALNRVPASLVIILLAREMTINGLRAIASSEGLILAASELGKLKTAMQMVGVMCLLVHYPYPVYFLGLHEGVVDFNKIGLIVMWGSVGLSLLSGGEYFREFFRSLEGKRTDGKA